MNLVGNNYEPYASSFAMPTAALSRSDARQAYERLMQAKPTRIEMLRTLLKADGVELGSSDAAIQALNDWFYAGVEPDPENAGQLREGWYSVVSDIALFLGDLMIERHPNLHWELFIWGKKNVSYQCPVIMGFSTEDAKHHTNINVHGGVATYGHRIIVSRGSVPTYGKVIVRGVVIDVDAVAAGQRGGIVETDAFLQWLQNAARRA